MTRVVYCIILFYTPCYNIMLYLVEEPVAIHICWALLVDGCEDDMGEFRRGSCAMEVRWRLTGNSSKAIIYRYHYVCEGCLCLDTC